MLELSCTQERHIRHQERLMNKNTIAIAIAALLVGGVSVAAFQQARGPDTADAAIGPGGLEGQGLAQDDAAPIENSRPHGGRVAYANVGAGRPTPPQERLMHEITTRRGSAGLLVGAVSVAAFQQARGPDTADAAIGAGDLGGEGLAQDDAAPFDNSIPDGGRVAYANVVAVEPITETEKLYATVIGTDPVRETSTSSTPREVCNDVVVQERLPERDGNVGGTVAGAIIGGLVDRKSTRPNSSH